MFILPQGPNKSPNLVWKLKLSKLHDKETGIAFGISGFLGCDAVQEVFSECLILKMKVP
jgi:hypothetical protein